MICIQLGSNKEDRLAILRNAKSMLLNKLRIINEGDIFVTSAWGIVDQPDFYNQLILMESELNPYELVRFTQKVELDLGRVRGKKWGPRIIDIDIIYYDNKVIYSPELCIPHKHMNERKFILEPLLELDKTWVHPVEKMGIVALLERCKDKGKVKRLNVEEDTI